MAKQQYNEITAVNATAGTVSISHRGGKDEQNRDLKTSAFTEIVVDGKKATLAALKAGMHVTYTLGGDGETAAHIETVHARGDGHAFFPGQPLALWVNSCPPATTW